MGVGSPSSSEHGGGFPRQTDDKHGCLLHNEGARRGPLPLRGRGRRPLSEPPAGCLPEVGELAVQLLRRQRRGRCRDRVGQRPAGSRVVEVARDDVGVDVWYGVAEELIVQVARLAMRTQAVRLPILQVVTDLHDGTRPAGAEHVVRAIRLAIRPNAGSN